jgi:hypothetical protein
MTAKQKTELWLGIAVLVLGAVACGIYSFVVM